MLWPKQGDFSHSVSTEERSELARASDLKHIVTVATCSRPQVEWPDAIGPDSVDAANLEQQILHRLAYMRAEDSEMFDRWHSAGNAEVQRSRKQFLARGGLEHVWIVFDSGPKVANAVENCSAENQHRLRPNVKVRGCALLRSPSRLPG
jgi:hypothetical protein